MLILWTKFKLLTGFQVCIIYSIGRLRKMQSSMNKLCVMPFAPKIHVEDSTASIIRHIVVINGKRLHYAAAAACSRSHKPTVKLVSGGDHSLPLTVCSWLTAFC